MAFDAVVIVSFGGPEGPDDVMPFLENVLRGRPVSPERVEQVAAHYQELGGVSPINAQNRALVDALRPALARQGLDLPVYWGNRNWHPFLADTVRAMQADGVRRAAAFVTSAYSSYSSCRQYVEDLVSARTAAGEGAPELVKLRPFFNHPGFVEPLADGLRATWNAVGGDRGPGGDLPVLMTAHSIPVSMAATCDYERQLRETAGLVAERAGLRPDQWTIVYQSRSGPPGQPWLGPDINDAITARSPVPGQAVVVVPIGFVSDHMEVTYDLDRTAATTAASRGIRLVRSPTSGRDPRFVDMICDLVEEADGRRPPAMLGEMAPVVCPCTGGCERAAAPLGTAVRG